MTTSPSLLSFMQFLLLFAYVRHTVFLGLMLITRGWNIYFESCVICMSFRSQPLSLHTFAHYFIKTAAPEVISLDISTHDSSPVKPLSSTLTLLLKMLDIPFCPVSLIFLNSSFVLVFNPQVIFNRSTIAKPFLNISHTFARRKYTQ